MFDIDGAFVEFGLKEVALAEKVKWNRDVETTQMRFMNGSSAVAQTGCTFEGRIEVDDEQGIGRSLFDTDGAHNTIDITLTGILEPKVVRFKNCIISSVESGIGEPTTVEFIAESLEQENVW